MKTKIRNIILMIFICISVAVFTAYSPAGGSNNSEARIDMNLNWIQNSYWFQGKAELNYYDAVIYKYGKPRNAERVVHIFVTEKHKPDLLVKADNWRQDGLVDMLKLNINRTIQTGIYTYHEMMSLFFQQKNLNLAKMTFSSQEWCGNSFKELVNFRERESFHYNTYWDGEGRGQYDVNFSDGLFLYDALPGQLRMIRLQPGYSAEVPFLQSQISSKAPFPAEKTAEIRVEEEVSVDVPAGTFECYRVEVTHPKGLDTFWIEKEFPHRMIEWRAYNGDNYRMLKSQYLAYWKFNDPGDEKYLP